MECNKFRLQTITRTTFTYCSCCIGVKHFTKNTETNDMTNEKRTCRTCRCVVSLPLQYQYISDSLGVELYYSRTKYSKLSYLGVHPHKLAHVKVFSKFSKCYNCVPQLKSCEKLFQSADFIVSSFIKTMRQRIKVKHTIGGTVIEKPMRPKKVYKLFKPFTDKFFLLALSLY